MTSNNEKKLLTKSDINRVFLEILYGQCIL